MVYSRISIYILNSLVDIEMIDRLIPVQITQQENHSNTKHYHKKTLKPFHRLIIAKKPKTKVKTIIELSSANKD